MATRTHTQSPALHLADSRDLICVQGARAAEATVGTATDANAMLRIVFSRLDEPSVRAVVPIQLQPARRRLPALRGHGPA